MCITSIKHVHSDKMIEWERIIIFLTYHLKLNERFYNIVLVLALGTSEC
jgi:hypothetical protein